MSLLLERYSEEIEGLLARYPEGQKKSAVLPLMHLAQTAHGFMSQTAMKEVADVLGIDSTHVLSLAGFYSLFYEEEVGQYVLEVCTDLACALRGGDEFIEMASKKLDVPVGGTTNDGMFTLYHVMCLGACDTAPMMQCNLKFEENLNEEKFDALIAELREKAASDAKGQHVVERIASYAKK